MGRWGYEVESKDLMKNHWNCSCFKAETKDELTLPPFTTKANWRPREIIRHEIKFRCADRIMTNIF